MGHDGTPEIAASYTTLFAGKITNCTVPTPPTACSDYTLCADLEGECCPSAAGINLGCCAGGPANPILDRTMLAVLMCESTERTVEVAQSAACATILADEDCKSAAPERCGDSPLGYSAFAEELLHLDWAASGRMFCCNHWSDATGEARLHCLRGSAGAFVVSYVAVVGGIATIVAILFLLSQRMRWRALYEARARETKAGARDTAARKQRSSRTSRSGGGHQFTGEQMKESQRQLAEALLAELDEAASLPPASARLPTAAAGSSSQGEGHLAAQAAAAEPSLSSVEHNPLPEGWVELSDEGQGAYFVHQETGETTRERPRGAAGGAAVAAGGVATRAEIASGAGVSPTVAVAGVAGVAGAVGGIAAVVGADADEHDEDGDLALDAAGDGELESRFESFGVGIAPIAAPDPPVAPTVSSSADEGTELTAVDFSLQPPAPAFTRTTSNLDALARARASRASSGDSEHSPRTPQQAVPPRPSQSPTAPPPTAAPPPAAPTLAQDPTPDLTPEWEDTPAEWGEPTPPSVPPSPPHSPPRPTEVAALASSRAGRRRAAFEHLRSAGFGFQEDSMRNQHEHLTSLIVSFMARNGGDYDRAVLDLHAKLLGGAEKWRESVRSTQAQAWVSSTFVPESEQQNPWIKMHTPRDSSLRSRTDAAGVVTEGGTYGKWVHLSTVQMEEEAILFLCVWGEASSVRFCPEAIYFVFELARSYFLSWKDRYEPRVGGISRQGRKAGDFLESIIKPIYTELLRERQSDVRTLPSEKRNYDDFNEAFWTYDHGLALLMAQGVGTDGPTAIMDRPPSQRYPLLRRADW